MCIDARLFMPVAALPQWELSMKVTQLLGLQGPWWRQVCRDMDCLHWRSYGPLRVFFWTSCSWWSEGLFGQFSSMLRLLRHISCVWLCATHRAPLSLGSSSQEYWSGLPFPSPMHACMLSLISCVRLCVTPWTAAHQTALSMECSRQEYWSGLPFPSLPP